MNATELPGTVVQVLGQQASEDLQTWLEARLLWRASGSAGADLGIRSAPKGQRVDVGAGEQPLARGGTGPGADA
jgi:hypothetical protein